MREFCNRTVFLCLILALTISSAYSCAGCHEREHSLFPFGSGYIYLIILAFVTFKLTGNALYPLPFVMGGFYIFFSSISSHKETVRLCALITAYSFINLLLYFINMNNDNEKKPDSLCLALILIPVAIFAFCSLNRFPVALRPDFLQCENNLTEIGEALEKFKETENRYPNEIPQLIPRYLKKLPRCINEMNPDSMAGIY